jgi:hypothetical protein
MTLANVAAGSSPSGTFDFSGATQLKHPVAAGYVSAANGELGYDSTNLNWHGWANGADEFFAGFSAASPPTSGHLAEFSKSANSWSLVDGGAPTSGTVTSIATTSPLTGGPITASGTIACATCVTSASTLSSNNLMTGAGSQGAQTVNLTGYVFANGSSAPAASSTIPIGSVGSAGLSGTSPITVASSGAIACPTCNTSSATVTSFSAPSGSWPSWLVPTVTNSTSTPSLAVASSMTLANVAAGSSPSGTFDFSGATQLKHPVAAGYVSAANGELGYDSTNLNWHGWANGADEFFAGFSVAAPPTSGHLAEFSKSANSWSLVDGGAIGALASQGYPSAGIVTSTGSSLSSESTVTAGQFPALTGDVTTPGGSLTTTLATVNSSPGSCGSASVVCAITTNGKGLVTAQTATTIAIPYSQVSGTPTLAQTIAAVSHEWLNSYSATTGAFTQTEPTLADIAAGATGSGNYDFSGATQLKHPVAAGYVSAANGELGYDSTNLNWHGWANGADEFFAGFSVSAPPTSGHLAEFSESSNSWSLVDGGAIGALASQGFPASGIVNSTGSAWGTSYSTSGTGTTVALTAAPTFTGTTTLATAAVTTFSGTPNFSGAVTGQTAATSDNSTKLATTAYVQAQAVIAAATYAPIASPTFTGTATIPTAAVTTFTGTPNFSGAATGQTAATADDSTKLATTAYVQNQAYAPLASPTFSGTVTIPTAAVTTFSGTPNFSGAATGQTASTGDNSTKVATTAYVQNQGYVTSSSGEATVATANYTGQSASIATTTLFTPVISGLYTMLVYVNQSAFCSNVGPGGVNYYLYYTDSGGANNHSVAITFNTVFTSGNTISSTFTFWAIGGDAISYAFNYTACTSGTAKYDAHVALNTN